MSVTVGHILDLINEIAPPELAESYDNVGLLVGHPDWPVDRIMVALDLTQGAVEEARRNGAQLIVTHHPIFFRGRKNIREDDPEGAAVCSLIRSGIAMIAAHTNFDNAPEGVNDALARELGLEEIHTIGTGMRMGRLSESLTVSEFAGLVRNALGGSVRIYAERPDSAVERVAVCGGSGGSFWRIAAENGAQAFVTGEASYHDALSAVASGLCMIESGHYETEHIALKLLADCLQDKINAVQYNVYVDVSAHAPFWRFEG
ncbi:MAG: Nif3-like dinuclear metal center hexameric protein [Clostridia bacterium]|nr:Nif3-like dinuclear metal center hexameric protein [Clostridia bacterium]